MNAAADPSALQDGPGGTWSAESFVALAEHSRDVIARLDLEGRYLFVNRAHEELLGAPREKLLGRSVFDIGLDVEATDAAQHALAQLRNGADQVTTRASMALPGRATRWLEATWMLERDPAGDPSAVLVVTRDVTAQVSVEAALAESEVRFTAVFDNVPFGVAVSTRGVHGYVTNANRALAAMLGYTRAELAQMHFSEITHPEDVAADARLLEQLAAGLRNSYSVEKRLVRKDGSIFWVNLQVTAVRDADGTTRFAIGITEDITERKEMEIALRASEERFRALVEHSSDLIAIFEDDGRVRYASPSQRELLGYEEDELYRMNALQFVHPDDLARAQERIELSRTTKSLPPERPLRFRSRDGTWRSLMATLTDMNDNPAVGGFILNARDVTEELRLQEQLTQAQKMEALGQLAGGVAHDFNNILAAISGYAELLMLDLDPASTAAADVREIAAATARGSGVTKQLLAFSRRQTLETEVLDLATVIGETGRMLRVLLPATIDLDMPDAGGPIVAVRAARAQVEQIIMNLAVNARDAMPQGGVLKIRLERQRRPDGAAAVLTLTDSGAGMTEEVRARAFEPFFTTKPKGQGTGLGLATVYGLVRQFGGQIDIESSPEVGTRFTIGLPLATDDEVEPTRPAPAAAVALPSARVLVAEDEPQLRALMLRALERRGFAVTTVGDGASALAALHGPVQFDLVISDVAMPRMGGRELAAAAHAGWPELPVILMSGYAELGATPEADSGLPDNVAAFIEKPFEVERLLAIVGEALTTDA